MPQLQQTDRFPTGILGERPGYFAVCGASLYTVLHPVENPVARILLVGPFTLERHTSYRAWTQWARFLAAQGIEVLRYDYRGIGESTGRFEDMTFESWADDVQCLSAWLRKRGRMYPCYCMVWRWAACWPGGHSMPVWQMLCSCGQRLRMRTRSCDPLCSVGLGRSNC